ncbi:hypothetical protein [Streptomyces qinglanensis]|uniref:hypothetical protein n=1 Tax=Streptomyces qinglanensis TaxID=943816 RepID=UPI003D70A536
MQSPPASAGTAAAESVESLRTQRDQLADFIRQLAADNPRTMTLDATAHRRALDLLDGLPVPERCLAADSSDPDGGHVFFLPAEKGVRCLNCRALRPASPHAA